MSISPLARNLMIGAGALTAGGVATWALVNHRSNEREAAEQARQARDAKLTVDAFVGGVIAHYDRGDLDPLRPTGYGHAGDSQAVDGVLTLGMEDYANAWYGKVLHPETVSMGEHGVQSARAMLTAADADSNGKVTREELTAAVRPFAGSDGTLDQDERRRVLLDEGLGEPLASQDFVSPDRYSGIERAGNVGTELVEAGALGPLEFGDLKDAGSPAVRIADVEAEVAATGWETRPDGRTISSVTPFLTIIEREHGNGNGLLSRVEIGAWAAHELRDPTLPHGFVRYDDDLETKLADRVEPQRLGRLDTSRLSGGAYFDTTVPAADVQRHYGGDLTAWIDTHATVGGVPLGEYRGDARWQPDPRSGEPVHGER